MAKDVVIVGAAHRSGGVPRGRSNVKGYVRGFDVRTGKRLWIFHTIPQPGEFGNDTWEKDSWTYTGNAGVWAQISVDEELGLAYLPVELPTGDYYGGHRPGNGLFGESLVAVDLQHRPAEMAFPVRAPRHLGHGPAVRADPRRHLAERPDGESGRAADEAGVAVRVRSRSPVSRSGRSRSGRSPKATCRTNGTRRRSRSSTKPPAYDRQGVSTDDLIDFTPELRAEAMKLAAKYKIGPIFTPPIGQQGGGPARRRSCFRRQPAERIGRAARTIPKRTPSSCIRRPTSARSVFCHRRTSRCLTCTSCRGRRPPAYGALADPAPVREPTRRQLRHRPRRGRRGRRCAA